MTKDLRTYKEQIRVLKFNGFEYTRKGHGSHEIWSRGSEMIVLVNGGGGHCTNAMIFRRLIKEHNLVLVDGMGRKVY